MARSHDNINKFLNGLNSPTLSCLGTADLLGTAGGPERVRLRWEQVAALWCSYYATCLQSVEALLVLTDVLGTLAVGGEGLTWCHQSVVLFEPTLVTCTTRFGGGVPPLYGGMTAGHQQQRQ